uniref:Uncharacterized protein n=1 Tax=Lepeophtheirus salmonis TaxID=72036 RepID=A0A0K2UUW0_LEPSM
MEKYKCNGEYLHGITSKRNPPY